MPLPRPLVLLVLPFAAWGCRPAPTTAVAPTPAPAPVEAPAAAPEPIVAEPEPPRVAGDPADAEARRTADAQPYVVDPLASTKATSTLRISFAAARELPFNRELGALFVALPDARLFADERIDPTRDFDDVVYAIHDLSEARNGVVVVRHRLARVELQRGLERAATAQGLVIEWSDDGTAIRGNPHPLDTTVHDRDPRKLALLDDGTAIYAPEELLASTTSKPAAGTAAAFFAAAVAKPKPARRGKPPALRMLVSDLKQSIRRSTAPFAIPDRIELTVGARTKPEVEWDATFATADDAQAFEEFLAGELRTMVEGSSLLKLLVRPIYEAFALTRKAAHVRLHAQLEPAVISTLLAQTVSAMEKVGKPRPAPAPAPVDAGPPARP